jgi:hypothetical protein
MIVSDFWNAGKIPCPTYGSLREWRMRTTPKATKAKIEARRHCQLFRKIDTFRQISKNI